jgi:hypothetical protein
MTIDAGSVRCRSWASPWIVHTDEVIFRVRVRSMPGWSGMSDLIEIVDAMRGDVGYVCSVTVDRLLAPLSAAGFLVPERDTTWVPIGGPPWLARVRW